MFGDQITYNLPAVHGFAGDVGTRSAQILDLHREIYERTQALVEFFTGHGATGFFDAQHQMLHGLEGLAQTIGVHGHTVSRVADGAASTDQQITTFFA